MLNTILERWRLCALIAAAGLLAIAHAFQTFGGMAPCELCLKQRDVYWLAGGVALIAMLVVRTRPGAGLRTFSCALLFVIFAAQVGLAAYHAGVEWHFWPGPQSCTGASAAAVNVADLQKLLNATTTHPPSCDRPAWVFLGVSMAGWNAVAALILAVLSAAAYVHERRKPA